MKKASPVMICLMVALVVYGFATITVCQADNAKPYSPQPVEPLDNAKPYSPQPVEPLDNAKPYSPQPVEPLDNAKPY